MNAFLDIHTNSPIRFPFVMIDRILSVTEERIHTRKNVVLNDWFIQGHYQGFPVMPVPLMIEAMAQSSILLFKHVIGSTSSAAEFLGTDAPNKKTIGVLAGIEKIRARHPVYPGSVLEIFVNLVSVRVGSRQRYAKLFGQIWVEERVVLEGYFKTSAWDIEQ